ncbi:MAG: hypothetical protein JW748_13805 [Anaerolineales bacterium]|nr:hypothetical protein [Anaerolineales bacterium]
MNTTQLRIIGIGILFLLIFLTGFWVSRSGKPYDTFRMTVHKLIALADVVLLVLTVYWIHKSTPIQPAVLAAVILSMALFIAAIISGGLVSILGTGGMANLAPAARTAVSLSHKVLPYLTVLATAASLYLAVLLRSM